MSKSDPIPSDSAVDQAAAEWLFEREEGLTPARAEAFAAWCHRDPRHAEAVLRVEQTLRLLEGMPAVRGELEQRMGLKTGAPACPKAARIFPFPRLATAAGLAAALVLGFALWRNFSAASASAVQYSADASAQRSLVLSDGSVMDIDVNSTVSKQFTARERRVTLTKGQAYFHVAHNAAWPFIVTVGNLSVRAVGTAFCVKLSPKGVDVVVESGQVDVQHNGAPLDLPAGAARSLLSAGERLQITRVGGVETSQVQKCDAQAMRKSLNWQNPLTSFADVPLREVLDQFNRRNFTQLVLADDRLGDRKIGGSIDLSQVDAFVRLLESSRDIVAERMPSGEIVFRQAH